MCSSQAGEHRHMVHAESLSTLFAQPGADERGAVVGKTGKALIERSVQ